LRDLASDQGISLNALCVRALEDLVDPRFVGPGAMPAGHASWASLVSRFASAVEIEVAGTVVFGSAARGELRSGSDIDLLVVLRAGVPLSRGLYRSWDRWIAGDGVRREINAHFVHLPATVEAAGSLWLETALEGVVLADESDQVGAFLVALRRAIASGRFRRSEVHGQPCWSRAS
jgi:predicted nucleotidyltransferase